MKRKTKYMIILIIISIFLTKYFSLSTSNITNTEQIKIHFIDVGQGDSTLIELPNNEVMLIDAGEKKYSQKIIDYINKLQYKKINYLIGTHPHSDHIGALADIVNQYDIDKIYMPKITTTTKTYENLLNTINNKGLKINTAKKGVSIINTAKKGVSIINNDNLKIEIIAPTREYKDLNNSSAVLKITYKDNIFLFMGDAEKESEKDITDDIKADIIKIGHHGSNTSTSKEFINKVNPKYAIISVGKNNKYNHPSEEVINELEKKGITIYRTDIDGTITLTSDGYNIEKED